MNALAYWTGPGGRLFSSALIAMLLFTMLFMSFRLYASRRKKAYFSLTVSLAFIFLQQLMTIVFAAGGWSDSGGYSYLSPLLQMMSFVLLNMGVYQLYNPSKRRHYVFFYGLLVVGFGVSLTRFVWPLVLGEGASNPLLGSIALDLYMFILLLVCHTRVVPRIGQSGKYEFALLLYFLLHTAHVVDTYVFDGKQTFLNTVELTFPVLFYLIVFTLLFERVVELLQAIYESSITDTLTGLYNRRYFTRSVEHYLRSGQQVAAIFTDIDNFKKLNDTQGHQKGDEALKNVAHILKETCSEVGVCGRYGGEEMVVLVTDPDVDTAELCEELRKRIETEAGVTVSVGYSKSRAGMTAEELLKQADEAMYKAKTTGKNKVVGYSRGRSAMQG